MTKAHLFAFTIALAACSDGTDTDADIGPTDTATPGEDDWFIVGENIPGGVYLSAWSNGDTMMMAGGELGQGKGSIARLSPEGLCVEQDVADEALWWIHGHREGEWYAVGEKGTIVHEVDGTRTREDIETEATLYGVWDEGDTVWAVGGDLTNRPATGEVWVKRDGEWSLFQGNIEGMTFKVWDGWVVGEGYAAQIGESELLFTSWVDGDSPLPKLLTVRGDTSGTIYAAGDGESESHLLKNEGDGWVEMEGNLDCHLSAQIGVFPDEDGNVLFGGHYGSTSYLDADGWHCPSFPITSDHFHAAWVHQGQKYWIGGDLFNSDGGNYGVIASYGPTAAPLTATTCD